MRLTQDKGMERERQPQLHGLLSHLQLHPSSFHTAPQDRVAHRHTRIVVHRHIAGGDETFKGLMQLLNDEQEAVVNELLTATMATDATARWSLTHGTHTCGGKAPYDFLKWAQQLHLKDVSEQITQDTLIISSTGEPSTRKSSKSKEQPA